MGFKEWREQRKREKRERLIRSAPQRGRQHGVGWPPEPAPKDGPGPVQAKMRGTLSARVIRADGSVEDLGVIGKIGDHG